MTALAVLLVLGVLAFAIIRPRGLPECVAALPAAVLAIYAGLVTPVQARLAVADMLPTVGFLAAVLALAHLADALGVFRWLASVLGRSSRRDGHRLLTFVFVAGAVTTAALSLDATVVLLTPALLATARQEGLVARPYSYASVHLSNSASLLMPVSNLTNLLAFSAVGVSFLHFTALMALPWLVAVVVELLVFRWFFARDLDRPGHDDTVAPVPAPRVALTILGLTLAGFAVSGFAGIEPVWVAGAGAVALAVPALARRRTRVRRIVRETTPEFLLFVLALGVVVAGISHGPLGRLLADHLPSGTGFVDLLIVAVGAAVLANVVNNLPAIMMLTAALGAAAPSGAATTGLVLAALIGVNIGPNLTYVGSLATMLWRRVVAARGEPARLSTFTRLGLLTTPAALLAATAALWLALQI
ncbi:arsenic transporter [Rhodococcus sp. D2-41]|uniref:SLC13 family permease n=1 Tax=Speluncibacter jeojiensis TaxID=2710754 RepID=A0A9X4RD02_9ACTN|nr:ArsB/NhaD family transporter [Rhodococcus sp. D2-41]MDG3012087.1 arsenic transporter [Rhodococcus sp. D2-41]MDG3013612.1 SLC13 family permease [Corynebacteriales bacterium D3-21]